MTNAFFSTGVTTGTYADRLALTRTSANLGQLFYQTDTDEYVKYVTDVDGTNRWMQAVLKPGRNAIVNGGFDVWQRGTSFASGSAASPYYTVDRWQTIRGSLIAGATFSRQASDLTGFNYFLRCQRDSANATTNNLQVSTSLETVNVVRLQGRYLTLSFWARAGANYSAASSTLSVRLTTGTGTNSNVYTGFTSSINLILTTVTLTTSWQRFSLTIPSTLSTTQTQLGLNLYANPTGTASTNDYFDLAGVQLESGTAPSEFEVREYGDELRRCERYYQVYDTNLYYAAAMVRDTSFAAGAAYGGFPLRQTMFSAPTTTVSATGGSLFPSDLAVMETTPTHVSLVSSTSYSAGAVKSPRFKAISVAEL